MKKPFKHIVGRIDDGFMPTPDELFDLLGTPEEKRFEATDENFGQVKAASNEKPLSGRLDNRPTNAVK